MKKSLLFLLLCIVMPIQAANIYVKPSSLGGSDETGDGISWETAYATPTKAFGVASTSGDVIAIMQGTYVVTESLSNVAKTTDIKVQGGYTGTDEERVVDASNTIFEYAGSVAVRVLGDYGAGLVFSGISFQNLQPAASQYGIFVNIVAGANLSLEDCIVKNFVNKAGANVRGIIRFNGTATLSIDRCQIIDCEEKSTATHNAVITRNGGNATLIIKNSIIKGTTTKPFVTSAADGTNTHTITNCNFVNNPGGAGVNLSTNFTTTINNSIFYNSTLSGGGTLNNSYYNGSIGTLTANNSVLFSNASDVFSNETNFYPALTFAGIDNGDNTVFTEGDKDVVGNNRLVNSTVDIGAYENIVAPVGVAGSNVTSVGVATSSYYPYGASAQIPVTVAEGSVPDPLEGVLFTGTALDYTASVTVKAPQTIIFNASQADFEVTVSTTNVTVTSPTLVDGKYSSASSSIIYFTLNEGTENPVATVNDNPATPVLINGSDYSLTLSGLTGATNVVISASVKVFDVTLSKNSYVASTTGLIEGTQQKEYGYSDLTFTLATGAHSPYVTVNGVVKATTESSGVYSLPGFAINSVSDIVISAFAANVLPVSDDTYQRRGGEISGVYATETTLNSRGEPAGWARIPLMKFVPTEAMKIAGYNKAVLRMVPTATVADLTYTVRQFPVGYASIHDVPANDYTNLMKASVVGVTDQQVAFTANQPVELNVTDSYVLNFPDEITISLVKGSSNNTVHYLHSLENGNANYVPVLVFSEPNLSLTDNETVVSSNASYGNITVAAGKKLTVNTGVTLTGAKLILKSDENGTATFVNNGTATFATADVEQYLSTTDGRVWYYLASPVTTDHSNTVFGESALVGVYKENLHKYTNPVADTALVAGAGYVVKLSTSNPTYTFSGVLNDGNISVPVSRTGTTAAKRGFNLVGNPYPSYLDWDDVDKTNVMSTIWTRTFEGSAMVFKTYNADAQVGSDDETTARIAPLQAFWVKVPADKADIEGLTLDFNNSLRWHKTNDDAPLRAPTMVSGNAVEKNVGTQQLLRLQVSNGVNNDNAVIVFDNRASDLFDAFDSEKVTNNSDQIPEIYSLADGAVNPLVINCFKGMANSREFKLGFSTLVDGSFTIAALTRKNIENLSVVLVDKLLGLQHNLATAYTFVSNAVNTTERFSVRFQSEQTTVEMSENAPVASAYCNTNRRIVIALNNNAATGIKAQIYNVAGQLLSEQHLNANITRSEQSFEPGIYFVKIKSQKIKVIVN